MKLIATSDCHGKLSQALIPRGDVLILAGDLLANRSGDPDIDAAFQLNALRELDTYCGTLGFKHILMIAGNHDWVFERYKGARHVLKNIVYLEDSGIEIDGVNSGVRLTSHGFSTGRSTRRATDRNSHTIGA